MNKVVTSDAELSGMVHPARLAANGKLPAAPLRTRGFTESFAQIVAVLMRDRHFRNVPLSDLEWLVLPPVMLGQFGLAHVPQSHGKGNKTGDSQEGSTLVPVAVALWARVSANLDKALTENLDKQPRLQLPDWSSGSNVWLMAVAGDQRAVPKFLDQLLAKDFKGEQVKVRARSRDGKIAVKTLVQPA